MQEHYVTPHLEYGKPDIAVIHIRSNNVSYNNLGIDASMFAENIIKIGNKCIDYGLEEVVISFVFWKKLLDLVPLLERLMMNYGQQIKFWKAYFNHLLKSN